MKQFYYKWFKAGIICSVAGSILILGGYLNGGHSYIAHADLNKLEGNARNDDSNKIITLSRTDLGFLDSVDISLSDLDLEVLPSENENCAIAWEVGSVNGDSPVDYKIKDGVLTVTENNYVGDSYIQIDISFLADLFCSEKMEHPSNTVYLYVPAEKLRQVSIYNDMGDVTVQDSMDQLQSLGLQLATEFGEIHLPEELRKTLPENDDDLTSYSQKGNSDTTLTITCKDGDIVLSKL